MQATTFWGLGAKDWAELQEPLQRPLYESVLDELSLSARETLLDGGCGTGVLAWLATQRGISVTGLDMSEMFLEAARRRCPSTTFVNGDLQRLPFGAETFDAVAGCNSFQFTRDPVIAVREAARVLRPGGRLIIAVFDVPEKCEGATPIRAVVSLLPPSADGGPSPFSLSDEKRLERIVREGGLTPEGIRKVDTPWHYPDRETAARAFMSAGPLKHASSEVGEEKVRETLGAAMERYRQPDGSYLMRNVFMFIAGRKT
jgi:SAM-dependent methyltransferase